MNPTPMPVKMNNSPTKIVRVPKYIVEDLDKKFPNYRKSHLFELMYNTSLLKMESILRAPIKKEPEKRLPFK